MSESETWSYEVPNSGVRVTLGASISSLGPDEWAALTLRNAFDTSYRYLLFRELVEPGPAAIVAIFDGAGVVAAAHGARTTARTALFSHPWKLLGSPQFVRAEDAADEVLHRHEALLAELVGVGSESGLAWERLSATFGELFVIRGFDTSRVLTREGLDPGAAVGYVGALADGARELSRQAGLAGVCWQFVDPADACLREELCSLGYQRAVFTAATTFELPIGTYDDFLATLPSKRRRSHLKERSGLAASGLAVTSVPLANHVDRVVDLEIATLRRYGGTPDGEGMRQNRAHIAELFGPQARVPVVLMNDEIMACGLDLVGDLDYLALSFGCDYSKDRLPYVYSSISVYDPIRFCLERGIRVLRMGFEAFVPKISRGGTCIPRETWIWMSDSAARERLSPVLDLVTDRTMTYLRSVGAVVDPAWGSAS